jgi:hypothetical protein
VQGLISLNTGEVIREFGWTVLSHALYSVVWSHGGCYLWWICLRLMTTLCTMRT